jgi:hypothetical protein
MVTTDIHLEFQDEREQIDFEVAFKGWVKEWQLQQQIYRRLVASTAQPDEIKTPEAGATAPAPHRIGFERPEGLITIGGASMEVGGVTVEVEGLYVNLIPFF